MCSLCVHDVMSCYQIKDCLCACAHVCVRMCMHCVHTCTHACADVCTHVCKCMYTRVHVHALCSANNFPFVYSAVPWPTLNTAGYVT